MHPRRRCGQVVTVRLMSANTTTTNVNCFGAADGTATASADGQAPSATCGAAAKRMRPRPDLRRADTPLPLRTSTAAADAAARIAEPTQLGGQIGTTPATRDNANGGASVSASGGTAPYTYLWSNGGTNTSISGVPGGSYSVTITDAKECEITLPVNILSTGVPSVNAGDDAVITCATGNSIALNGTGSPGVTYTWLSSNGGNIASGADTPNPQVNAAGTYTLTVTDPQTQCSANDAVNVTHEHDGARSQHHRWWNAHLRYHQRPARWKQRNPGRATFSWTGPNGFNSTDEDVNADAPGTYELTVTDPSTDAQARPDRCR
ncbi:MAG: SprB repeat-containing protein [Flavobacteriales bacterium]|nr:SprB repeat-containing protein [Flavobacteriales bacterium]